MENKMREILDSNDRKDNHHYLYNIIQNRHKHTYFIYSFFKMEIVSVCKLGKMPAVLQQYHILHNVSKPEEIKACTLLQS